MSSDWYDRAIPDTEPNAEELRRLVRVLRNEGFNTTSCCGHTVPVYIECEWYEDDEATRLFELVASHTNRGFHLLFTWDLDQHGWSYRHVRIELEGGVQ